MPAMAGICGNLQQEPWISLATGRMNEAFSTPWGPHVSPKRLFSWPGILADGVYRSSRESFNHEDLVQTLHFMGACGPGRLSDLANITQE